MPLILKVQNTGFSCLPSTYLQCLTLATTVKFWDVVLLARSANNISLTQVKRVVSGVILLDRK